MASLFLNVASPARFAFPRSYINRLILSGNFISGPTFSGPVVDYVDTYNVRYHIELMPDFYAWSSNRWTLDHFIDIEQSHCYIGMTEVISGVFTAVQTVINEGNSQIRLESGGGAGIEYVWALPSPSAPYWLPQS